MVKKIKYDTCIIGSGPAGLTAAIYAARAGKSVCIFGGDVPLGQLANTTWVENYPGFPEPIMGPQLMENMKTQAINVGAEFIQQKVDRIELAKDAFKLIIGDEEYLAKSCIVATGSEPKWLGLKSEEEFKGYGVSSCATCDGFFYKGKNVAVIGGGNTAVEEAIYLSSLANKVTLIHRRDKLRADQVMQNRLLEKPNINILWDSEVHEFFGDEDPRALHSLLIYNNKTQETSKLEVDGAFVAVGHSPQSNLLQGIVELKDGYSKSKIVTKVSGLFVAGDVCDQVYRQAVTAAGDGCKAALEAVKFLESNAESAIVKENTKKSHDEMGKGIEKLQDRMKTIRRIVEDDRPRRSAPSRDRGERGYSGGYAPRSGSNPRMERREYQGDGFRREGQRDRYSSSSHGGDREGQRDRYSQSSHSGDRYSKPSSGGDRYSRPAMDRRDRYPQSSSMDRRQPSSGYGADSGRRGGYRDRKDSRGKPRRYGSSDGQQRRPSRFKVG